MTGTLEDKVAAVNVAVLLGTTLMKTKLLEGEKVVAEFVEEPVCNTFCREGTIRRIQLTTRRVIYYETSRKWCCVTAPPLLRQIFLKDVSEICVDNCSSLELGWCQQLTNFLLLYVVPLAGIALIVVGATAYDGGETYTIIGAILLAVFVLAAVLRFCRKKVPQIIFGTRCAQMPAFSIRFASADSRLKLLEEASALIHKNL